MFVPKPGLAITGIENRNYSDEEFKMLSDEYDSHFSPEQAGSLSRCFDRVADSAPAAPASSSAKTTRPAATPGDNVGG